MGALRTNRTGPLRVGWSEPESAPALCPKACAVAYYGLSAEPARRGCKRCLLRVFASDACAVYLQEACTCALPLAACVCYCCAPRLGALQRSIGLAGLEARR